LKKFSLRNIELAVSIELQTLKVKTNIGDSALVYCREFFLNAKQQCWRGLYS
jgi:hypothetical protein